MACLGPWLGGDESEQSDIDLFAEFADPRPETMPDRYFGFIHEASHRYNRKVQILTPRMVRNPFLKRSINRDMIILHKCGFEG